MTKMVWAYEPTLGGVDATARCDTEADYDRVLTLDTHVFDGQPAALCRSECVREHLFVRFRFEQPYRPPPMTLTMEDHAAAEAIAAVGAHVIEGVMYHVELREPGVLTLDRMFSGSPPPQFSGQLWRDASPEPVTA